MLSYLPTHGDSVKGRGDGDLDVGNGVRVEQNNLEREGSERVLLTSWLIGPFDLLRLSFIRCVSPFKGGNG